MTTTERDTNIKELGELIKGINIAMLTTAESDGTLRSRPMGTIDMDFDGTIWFFAQESSAKVDEVRHDHNVNLSYSDTDDSRFVSVSGTAAIVRDRAKMEELWTPTLKIWFKDGLDDPDIALIKVSVNQAEYWKASTNTVGKLIDIAKAYVTGDDSNLSENKKIDL